jgi:hypothetical protein
MISDAVWKWLKRLQIGVGAAIILISCLTFVLAGLNVGSLTQGEVLLQVIQLLVGLFFIALGLTTPIIKRSGARQRQIRESNRRES